MVTKHFLKTLIIFTGMIILGLTGIFLVGHFDKENNSKIFDNIGFAK